jgi:hypothetical protein
MHGWMVRKGNCTPTKYQNRERESTDCTVHYTALLCDENLLVMEIDVIVLMRGLDLAVFETSGRQKSKMVCVETSSCKATTPMRLIRVQNLLLACFLEHLIGMGCFGTPLSADNHLCRER